MCPRCDILSTMINSCDVPAARWRAPRRVTVSKGSVLVALLASALLTAAPALAQGPPAPQTVPSLGLKTPQAFPPATVPSLGLRSREALPTPTVPSIGVSTPRPYEAPSLGLKTLEVYPAITVPSIGTSTPRPYEVPSIGLTTPQAFPPVTVP